jgi:hypothetical protein
MGEPKGSERLEVEIARLNERDVPPRIELLKADIWKGVEARQIQKGNYNLVIGLQSLVLVLALSTSIAIGSQAAPTVSPSPELSAFSPRASLAPSTLLGG